MPNVFCVAEYILNKMGSVATMKLQKLVYYSQAWSLVWDDCPIFDEDFEAWANGPVCPELFYAHKGHFSVSEGFFRERICGELSQEQKETIEEVLKHYGDKAPQWLSELTHLERPWKETRGSAPVGGFSNEVIPKELMQEYYAGL